MFWLISLYVTDDAIAKLDVTESFVKYREMVEHTVLSHCVEALASVKFSKNTVFSTVDYSRLPWY